MILRPWFGAQPTELWPTSAQLTVSHNLLRSQISAEVLGRQHCWLKYCRLRVFMGGADDASALPPFYQALLRSRLSGDHSIPAIINHA